MKSKKIDLTRTVAEKTGFTLKDVTLVVDTFVNEMIKEILEGNEVHLSNFGKFIMTTSAPRKAMNPYTGEKIDIPERKHVKFRPTVVFQKRIN
jgi:nucleoid DNA-binding protein